MKAVILAAGYATRLYPLTRDTPKPLLKIGDKTILEHILLKLARVQEVEKLYLVTNARFYEIFKEWCAGNDFGREIKVINDNTTSNENRLGAIADLQYVIEQERLDDDLLVLAGDNIFEFELTDFVEFFREHDADSITCHQLDDLEELKRTGVVEIDEEGKVLSFVEKPAEPRSTLAVPPVYAYKRETLPLFREYLAGGNNPDAPGNFIPWLITKKDIYAYQFSGYRYDIGTVESYHKVNNLFNK